MSDPDELDEHMDRYGDIAVTLRDYLFMAVRERIASMQGRLGYKPEPKPKNHRYPALNAPETRKLPK